MIQVIGASDIYFSNKKTSIENVKEHLENSLVRFDIISHNTFHNENKVSIKFIMSMNDIAHCKTLDDYQSYIFTEFTKLLPNNVFSTNVFAYDIKPIENEPIKHIKHHMIEHMSSIFGE